MRLFTSTSKKHTPDKNGYPVSPSHDDLLTLLTESKRCRFHLLLHGGDRVVGPQTSTSEEDASATSKDASTASKVTGPASEDASATSEEDVCAAFKDTGAASEDASAASEEDAGAASEEDASTTYYS